MKIRSLISLIMVMALSSGFLSSCGLINSFLPGGAAQTPAPAVNAPQPPTATPKPTNTVPALATPVAQPTLLPFTYTPTPTFIARITNTPLPGVVIPVTSTVVPTSTTSVETPSAPTATVVPTNTIVLPVPTGSQPSLSPEMKSKIANARILILDTTYGSKRAIPRIYQAVEGLGLKGPNVVNTADASGYFLNYMKTEKWDLIIMGAENRDNTRFGIWDTVQTQIDSKAAVIVELWYLDKISDGVVTPLMNNCGIEVQRNWVRETTTDLEHFALFSMDPTNNIFHYPNEIKFPIPISYVWEGDVGDLIKPADPNKAKLLIGLNPEKPGLYGLLTECYSGRVLWQSFSTHDYPPETTIKLWQNYIIYTLVNHFNAMP